MSISAYPLLDPKRVVRIYKKLEIFSVDELREPLESGAIEKALGQRMAQHVRQGLTETHGMLLYRADVLRDAVEEFLLSKCGVRRADVVGDYRRRAEIIGDLEFIIDTDDFPSVVVPAATLWRPDAPRQLLKGHSPLYSFIRDSAASQAGFAHKLGPLDD